MRNSTTTNSHKQADAKHMFYKHKKYECINTYSNTHKKHGKHQNTTSKQNKTQIKQGNNPANHTPTNTHT